MKQYTPTKKCNTYKVYCFPCSHEQTYYGVHYMCTEFYIKSSRAQAECQHLIVAEHEYTIYLREILSLMLLEDTGWSVGTHCVHK